MIFKVKQCRLGIVRTIANWGHLQTNGSLPEAQPDCRTIFKTTAEPWRLQKSCSLFTPDSEAAAPLLLAQGQGSLSTASLFPFSGCTHLFPHISHCLLPRSAVLFAAPQ